MANTFYFYIEFTLPKEDTKQQAWVSVGKQPAEGSVEDEHTMYHFTSKEWNRLVKAIAAKKEVQVEGDFIVSDIIGGGDV